MTTYPDPPAPQRYNLLSRLNQACSIQSRYSLASSYLALAVLNKTTGDLEEYPALMRRPEKDTWFEAYGNDLYRLAQGMPGQKYGTDVGTETIKFIPRSQVPSNKK